MSYCYLSNTLVNMIFRMAGRIFFMSMQTKFCNFPQQEISNVYQGLIAQANIPTDWLVTYKGVKIKLRIRYLMPFLVLGGEKKDNYKCSCRLFKIQWARYCSKN